LKYFNKIKININSITYRVLSWVSGILIVGFLLSQVDLAILKKAAVEANIILFLLYLSIFILFWLLFESQNLYVLIKYFGYKAKYIDILAIRASTYLLMMLNYGLGTGGILLELNRKSGISLKHSSAVVLLYVNADNISLALLTFIPGLLFLEIMPTKIMIPLLAVAASFIITTICLIIFIKLYAVYMRHNNGTRSFFATIVFELSNFKFRRYFIIVALRTLYFASFSLFMYVAIPCFGFYVPFTALLALLPPIFFVGIIPITPAGIGTTQAAMLALFSPYGDQSKILLFSLTYTCSLILFRLLVALIAIALQYSKNNVKSIENIKT